MNVVSFFAPRRDHPFYQDYGPFLEVLRDSCAKYSHRHVVLTDDASVGVDGDAYVAPLPHNLMLAYLHAQLAYLEDPENADTPTLLTGADCVLARDPVAFAKHEADLVITVCDDFQDCRINMGAIYVRRPAAVAHIWREAIKLCKGEWGDDQRAFRDALAADTSDITVIELPVDPWNLAPNNPDDDCLRGYVLHFRGPRKRWMVSYCHQWLGVGPGIQLTVLPNSDVATARANIRLNILNPCPVLSSREAHDGEALIVGSGPSALDTLDMIVSLGQHPNVTIFGLNGAVRWLEDHGVVADYGVILDARPGNERFVVGTAPNEGWLVATQCDPAVFSAADKVTRYHFADPECMGAFPFNEMAVGGGLTVGLTTMAIAFAMGFRRIHLFGYDSSERDGQTHLIEQPKTGPENMKLEVFHGGRTFITSPGMLKQAEAFEPWCRTLMDEGMEIVVHGDGLLPSIAHSMLKQAA